MKTRAFDLIENRWRTDYVVTPDGKICMMTAGKDFFIDQSINLVQQPDWKLSRFTGLLDKNGKEIYEGDIVRVVECDMKINPRDSDTGFGVIEWLDVMGGWYIDRIHNSLMDINNAYYIEVIGDIFQNPELLEVE